MKKLFISCPMKGRTEENIRKSMEQMHKIAEIVFGEELEVIDTYINEDAPKNVVKHGLWYLGKSIEMLAEADYFIGVEYTEIFHGCEIENRVAMSYGIRSTHVKMYELMPDVVEVEREYWNSCEKTCAPMPC